MEAISLAARERGTVGLSLCAGTFVSKLWEDLHKRSFVLIREMERLDVFHLPRRGADEILDPVFLENIDKGCVHFERVVLRSLSDLSLKKFT